MMTNLLNGAHVANKLFSTIARLRLLLVMFLTLTVTANAWGTEYTLVTNVSDLSNGDKVIIATKNNNNPSTGVTGGTVQASTSTKKDATTSSTEADWMQFTVTTTTEGWYLSNTSSQYIGKPTDNTFYLTTATNCKGVCSVNNDGVLCCNSRYLQKNSSFYRMYSEINNSYTPFYVWKVSASYTITAKSNNSTYGTVSLSGTTIKATPNDGYRVKSGTAGYTVNSGTVTVTNNGDNTFTIAPSSNCTITINFEAIPTHKVYFNTGGLVDIESVDVQEGQTYNITQTPASSLTQECEYNTFVGWTKSNKIANPSSKPTIVNSIEMESSDITLYAVYSKTEGGGGSAAEQGTTMFSENWKGCTNNTQPTQPTTSGSAVYNAADIDYVWYTPSGGSKTQTYTSGGPNSNENILISKNNGYWKVVGIPTGQAETLTLSFSKSGSGVLSVSTSTSNVSISGSTITIGSSSVNTFDLIFTNTKSGDNLRLDDISVVVAKAGATGSTTYSLTPQCSTEPSRYLTPKH